MNFLFPAAFFLAVLIPAIIALYLQRPRQRLRVVPSLMLWQRVLEREPRRRFLGRLRRWLSLLLQLLIFLLLLLALARPDFFHPRGQRSTVIVLDLRARMQAGNTFFDAIAAARQASAGAGPDEQIAILGAAGAPRIISPFSSDPIQLRQSLANLTPSDGGGSLDETLGLARDLLAGRPGATRLLVITDRPLPENSAAPTGPAANAPATQAILTGSPLDNAAILELAQAPLPASPQSAEVFVKVANFAAAPRDIEWELRLDGRTIDLQSQKLAPGEQRDFSSIVPAESLQSLTGFLEARLTSGDKFPVDDTARTWLPVQRRTPVLLISAGNPYLEGALKADPSIALEILTPDAWRASLAASFRVVVFDDWLPADLTLANLPASGVLFFGKVSGETSQPLPVADLTADPRSPLLWNVDFTTTRFANAAPLPPAPTGWRATPVVTSASGPLVLALESPEGRRVVATAFPVAGSNFPLKAAFPLFISNTVHWLAAGPAALPNLRAGQVYVPAEGESVANTPGEKHDAWSTTPTLLDRVGFYERTDAHSSSWLSVNTADAAESDLRTATGSGGLLLSAARFAGFQLWQWLALAAATLILLEWWLHHRRLTE